jgi:hypothetical protein
MNDDIRHVLRVILDVFAVMLNVFVIGSLICLAAAAWLLIAMLLIP